MPSVQASVAELAALLRSHKLPFGNEAALQSAVAELLNAHGITFAREHRLDAANRLDFLVGGVAIECKVDGSQSAVLRQLRRYAGHSEVTSLLLVTSRHTHRRWDTAVINDKPFAVVWVAGTL